MPQLYGWEHITYIAICLVVGASAIVCAKLFAKTEKAQTLTMRFAGGVLLAVIWIYNVINVIINAIAGTETVTYFGVEPIFFGFLYMCVDILFIKIKNTAASIMADAKNKNGVK